MHTGGGSWRRAGDDKREAPKEEHEAPPRPRDRDLDVDGEKSSWRSDKDNARRIKNETDDDGWTTVRR